MNVRNPWQAIRNLPVDPVAAKNARVLPNCIYWMATVLYNWVCTQFAAWELHDDRTLGWHPIKGVYLPGEWLWWASFLLPAHYRSHASATHMEIVFGLTVDLAVIGFALSLMLYKCLYDHALLHAQRPPDVHGSAHFADRDEVHATGLLLSPTSRRP